jgi:microsomal dipeptidase-like Zn-dependent dipeptidase
MPFFDFHIHPTLKSLFSDDAAASGKVKFSPWKKIDNKNIPLLLKCCTDFPYILESQGNLAQLVYNDCNLVCIALYIPENDMITDDMITQAEAGTLGIYLQKDKIDRIIKSDPFQLLMNDDWDTLTNATKFGINDKKIKVIRNRSDYNENVTDTIHVVFSVEGCHTLSTQLQNFNVPAIIANLTTLQQKLSLLSINLTHMENSTLCNQAYGMQFLSNDGFKPIGNGIQAAGLEVLKYCYTNKIMIDVKHLSLASRRQLYDLRKTPEFQQIVQPIVCTHAGFTGISIKEIPDYLYNQPRSFNAGYTLVWQGKPVKYGKDPRPSFNASSINLYDEDIIEILLSGGMIGLSLDKRILGFQEYEIETSGRDDFPLETEYVSNLEIDRFLDSQGTGGVVEIGKAFEEGNCLGWNEIQEQGTVNPSLAEHHLRYFMAHVLHVIALTKDPANDLDVHAVLTQLCIGSDFDGLINPVWICPTADGLNYFKDQFKRDFTDFADESQVDLPPDFDINKFADQLFFENGKNFVLNRLDSINA